LSVQVWKDPNCGCCQNWVEHLQKNGFEPIVFDEGNVSARARLGMPRQFGSCHTALVQGYVIEGHVPAADVKRLLDERPSALGLAVPGMPVGSPGMDGAVYSGRRDPYDVLLIQRNGAQSVFSTYRKGLHPDAASLVRRAAPIRDRTPLGSNLSSQRLA
jgi:hypothetical protein